MEVIVKSETPPSGQNCDHCEALATHRRTLETSGYQGGLTWHMDFCDEHAKILLSETGTKSAKATGASSLPTELADNGESLVDSTHVRQMARYLFTDAQMYSVLDGAVSMFFEYRDQYGKEEDAAKHAAIQEIIEGLDAEKELISMGETVGNPTQVILSSQGVRLPATSVESTETDLGSETPVVAQTSATTGPMEQP